MIALYLQYLNMRDDRSIVLAQATTTTIKMCTDIQNELNCCGNHIKEPSNGEECDYSNSDCQCFETCDTSCKCHDFRPTLSSCSYYDNCSSTPGQECHCNVPPGEICRNENCWNATEEICNNSARICNTWFICS